MNTCEQSYLPPPSLPQLSQDGTLSMAQIRRSGVTIIVPIYPGMKIGDSLSTPWEGTPQTSEVTFPQIHTVQHIKALTLQIPYSSVHEEWKKLKVRYSVKNNADSEWVEVDIVP